MVAGKLWVIAEVAPGRFFPEELSIDETRESATLLTRSGTRLVPCCAFILQDGGAIIGFNPQDGPLVTSPAPGPFSMLLYHGRPIFAYAPHVTTSPPVDKHTFLWHHGTKTELVIQSLQHLTPALWGRLTDPFRGIPPKDIISKAFADALALDEEDDDEDEDEDDDEENVGGEEESKLPTVEEEDEDEDGEEEDEDEEAGSDEEEEGDEDGMSDYSDDDDDGVVGDGAAAPAAGDGGGEGAEDEENNSA